jgi:hypothetical protein
MAEIIEWVQTGKLWCNGMCLSVEYRAGNRYSPIAISDWIWELAIWACISGPQDSNQI